MADKRIEELPILSTDDFNFSRDYVIVQQPGGGTYKMIVGQAFADINSGGTYVDYKNVTLEGLNSTTLEFNALNLLSENSAWKMDFVTRVTSIKGSSQSYEYSGISKGDVRFFSVLKKQNSNLVGENNIGGSSSVSFASFQNTWAKLSYSSKAGTSAANYIADINTSLGIDQMKVSINPSASWETYYKFGQSYSTGSDFRNSMLTAVEITVNIYANLRP